MMERYADKITAKILASLPQRLVQYIDHDSFCRLQKHNPSDPFSSTTVELRMCGYSKGILTLAGNSIRHEKTQTWFDENGDIIPSKGRGEREWSALQTEAIVDQIAQLGKKVSFHPEWIKAHPKEPGEICLTLPHCYSGNLGIISTHYTSINVMMLKASGKMETRYFRTDSIGRQDIGQRIVDYLDTLSRAMPSSPEEAIARAEERALQDIKQDYAEYGIEPIVETLKAEGAHEGVAVNVRINMIDGAYESYTTLQSGTIQGMDAKDPMKINWYTNKQKRCREIKAESARRATQNKNNGLIQTVFAKQIKDIAGMEKQPMYSDYKAQIKKKRFFLQSQFDGKGKVEGYLFIKDGRIEAEFHIGTNIHVKTGKVTIKKQDELPESIMVRLKGKQLKTIIDHPIIPNGVKITSLKLEGTTLTVRIKADSIPVDTKQGAEN